MNSSIAIPVRSTSPMTLLVLIAQIACCNEPDSTLNTSTTGISSSRQNNGASADCCGMVHRVVLSPSVGKKLSSKDVQDTNVFQEGMSPDSNYQHDGADVWQCEPDTNYEGDDLWIFGRHDGLNSECFGWPYMKFDLTGSIPDGAMVVQAVLSMYLDSGYGNYQTGASHKVLSDWSESSLTFNSAPSDWSNGQYESQVYITQVGRWWDWDITQMTSDWVTDPSSNFGVAIMPIDELYNDDVLYWASDDSQISSQRPKLTVDYILPEHRASFVDQTPPPSTMYLQQEAEVSLTFKNDGVDQWSQAGGYGLGSQNPADNNTWGLSMVELPSTVGTGSTAVFDFEITAPDSPGTYTFQWQMKDDVAGWFGDPSEPIDVMVEKKPLSTTCQADSECSSGNCVDGYCCDGFCVGLCQSCALAGFEGNCRYIPPGQDPDEECIGTGICGSYCDGTGNCVFPQLGTRCADCASCDGEGNCNQYEPGGTDPADRCGLCRVCPGDGPDCVAAQAGTDPVDECRYFPAETCGQTGQCDGAGACELYPDDTLCGPETCTAAIHHPADRCDGAGNCIISQDEPCTPYACLDAVSCRTDCQDDSDCAGDSHCVQGSCAAYIHLGQDCANDAECITGHCVDGVCCENTCEGLCQACNLDPNPGTCMTVPQGQDPRQDCPGDGICGGVCDGQGQCAFAPDTTRCDVCTSCDGQGFCTHLSARQQDPFDDCAPCFACSGQDASCVPVPEGEDPLEDCEETPQETCSTTGTCDGAGGCELWPADTICNPAACHDGILEPADLCDGLGSCFDLGQLNCEPYTCLSPDACRDTCEDDTNCAAGFHCDEQSCQENLIDGSACVRDGQCRNGHCVDGVCCQSACKGLCQRCDLQGSVGTCTAIFAGQDPDAECAGDGVCGGSCDGQGQCLLPGEDTACAPCARCDGHGSCSVFVQAGQDPEDRCGPCMVCAGDREDCVAIDAGQDPFDECQQQDPSTCGTDGTCDGNGSCHLWPSGTICGEQSCLAGVLHRPDTCDGQGQCEQRGEQDCAPYTCDGDFCSGPEGLTHISIEDSPDGSGQPIVDMQLTTDDSLELFALGRDAQGESLGPVVVTWSVQGDMGSAQPGPSTSTMFDPTTPGAGKIAADFYDPDVQDALTGDIVVTPGIAAGEFPLEANPSIIPADGEAVSTVTGGPVLDADQNPVEPGTMVTVLSSQGEIDSQDADQLRPGIQRATDQQGLFSFSVTAPALAGRARLLATTVAPHQATGHGILYFGDGRPVANAGEDQRVTSGEHVTLDGGESFDPGNRMLSFQWVQTAGDQVELLGQDTESPKFDAPELTGSEDLQFQLMVSAGEDQSDPDSVTVTVMGSERDLPTAVISLQPETGPAPLDVTLDASQSHAADCCELVAYQWFLPDGTQIQAKTVTYSFSKPGTVGIELMVTDDKGSFSFARDQVVVTDGHSSPPSLLATATPSRGAAPLNVTFRAQATDPDGTIELIEWDMGGGFVITGPEQQHLFSQAGLYQVRVRATDDSGLHAEQVIHIAVSDNGTYAPSIISTPANTAHVSKSWFYAPMAVGTPPFDWSLGKHVGEQLLGAPQGMQINPETGKLTWIPSDSQLGPVNVTLVVKNHAGSDFQDFQVAVSSSEQQSGCGCTTQRSPAAGVGLLWLFLALAWFSKKLSR